MIDRLIDKIVEKQNPTVVGLDPRLEMVPQFIKESILVNMAKHQKRLVKYFLNLTGEL